MQGRWSTEILRTPEQSFFHCTLQTYGLIWMSKFEQNEKKFTSRALVVALKKKLKTYNHFSRLFLHFPDFFQAWKIARQTSWLFKNSRLCTNPVNRKVSAKVTFQFCSDKRQHILSIDGSLVQCRVTRVSYTSTMYQHSLQWLYGVNKRKIFPTCRVHSFFVSATIRYVLPIIAINMLTINNAPRIINKKNMI